MEGVIGLICPVAGWHQSRDLKQDMFLTLQTGGQKLKMELDRLRWPSAWRLEGSLFYCLSQLPEVSRDPSLMASYLFTKVLLFLLFFVSSCLCIILSHMCLFPMKVRRRSGSPWILSCGLSWVSMWVLGTGPTSSAEQPMLLPAEPSL